MVDIFLLSKTAPPNPVDPNIYWFIVKKDEIRFATEEEIERMPEDLISAYKVSFNMSSVALSLQSISLSCDRWVVEFGEGDVCDLRSLSIIFDSAIMLFSNQMIPFQQSGPIFIRKFDKLFCQPIKYNFRRDLCRRTAIYISDFESVKVDQTIEKFTTQPRLNAIFEKDDSAATAIKSSTISNDMSSVHLIVRVDDQQRSIQGDISSFPGYIDNANFEKYFGSNPKIITFNGCPTQYYMSLKLEKPEEFVKRDDLGFMNVYERCFLIVSPLVDDEKRQAYGFSYPFICNNQIYAPFKEMIEYVSSLEAGAVTTKTVHIVQSSGMGKTRICFQMLEDLKRGIYCVYRLSGSSGYPRTTPWFTELVNEYNGCNSDDAAVWACLKFIYLIVNYKTNIQTSNGEDAESSFLHFNNRCVKETIRMFRSSKKFKIQAEELTNRVKAGFKDVSLNMKALVTNIKESVGNALFPIVFDECHELLITSATNPGVISLYRAIRRALGKLNETGIVGLFLGTKASLGDFTLNWRSDPSRREESIDTIVPPYLLTDSLDVHLNREFVINYENSNQVVTIKGNEFYRSKALEDFALCCGRPLWKCYGNYCTAFRIAKSKISSEPELIDLAAILIRISAEVSPHSKLAHRLVLSGMATLLYVDLNGETCLTYYCPEPLLSNAARIHMQDDKNFLDGLNQFLLRLNTGGFKNSGKAGEFVGRLLSLRAFDKALIKYEKKPESNTSTMQESNTADRNQNSTTTINEDINFLNISGNRLSPKLGLTTVLEYLIGFSGLSAEEILSNFNLSTEVMNGFVTCCQMVPVKSDVNMDQLFLKHGYARCVGFQLYENAPSADLIIPVLRTDDKMSCIAIQFKNYSEATSKFPYDKCTVSDKLRKSKMKYLNFNKCGEFEAVEDKDDFVRIVVQFQQKVEKSKHANVVPHAWSSTKVKSGTKRILWLRGLDAFDHLLSFEKNSESLTKIREALDGILSADRNYYDGLQFPEKDEKVNMFYRRQISKTGTLAHYTFASPCVNNEYLALYDAQGREIYSKKRDALLEKYKVLNIEESDFKDREKFEISIVSKAGNTSSQQNTNDVTETESDDNVMEGHTTTSIGSNDDSSITGNESDERGITPVGQANNSMAKTESDDNVMEGQVTTSTDSISGNESDDNGITPVGQANNSMTETDSDEKAVEGQTKRRKL